MFGPPAYSEPPEYYEDDLASERELARIKDAILNWAAKEYFEELGGKECLNWSVQDCIDNRILDEALLWTFCCGKTLKSSMQIRDLDLEAFLTECGIGDSHEQTVRWLIDSGLVEEDDVDANAEFILELLSKKTSEDEPPWVENGHIYWSRQNA